jgi:hemin uptake protein HemP
MAEEPIEDRVDDASGESPHARPPQPLKLFRSEELFQGQRVVFIEHAGAVYRLQITSRGKLILQK